MLRRFVLISSLLLLLTVLFLSIRSNTRSLVFGINTRTGSYCGATVCDNRVILAWCTVQETKRNHDNLFAATWTDSDVVRVYLSIYQQGSPSSWKTPLFDRTVVNRTWQVPTRGTIISFPAWYVTLLLSLPLMSMIYKRRRSRRWVREGRCRHCSYDLRGTSSTKCPECGTEFVTAAKGAP